VNGYSNNGSSISDIKDNVEWTNSRYFTASETGKIFLQVAIVNTAIETRRTGTFGIVYNTGSQKPMGTLNTAAAVPLTIDEWQDGEITSSDKEIWYSINGSAGSYYIWWDDLSQGVSDSTIDVIVTAYISSEYNENSIFSNEDSAWKPSRTIKLNSTGVAYIRVAPKYHGQTGTFKITYASSNARPWLTPIKTIMLTEDKWTDSLMRKDTRNGEVWYSFNAVNGSTYNVWLNDYAEGNGTGTSNAEFAAFDGNGTALFPVTENAWNSPQSFSSTSNGKIYIMAITSESNYLGYFAVSYSKSSTRPAFTAIELTQGKWSNGNVQPDSRQWFKFTATSESHVLHVICESMNGLYFYLYDKDFKFDGIGRGTNTGGYSLNNYFTIGDVYYLAVLSDYQNGTFKLAFNTSGTAPAQ